MDISNLSKTLNIGADYKDRRVQPNWEMRLFAEVIFIDKTHDGVKPLIYQLKDSLLEVKNETLTLHYAFGSFSQEAFILLGEMTSIDKKKKQILLSNNNVVAYNYLVIVTGAKSPFQEGDFSAGLQALIEAVRVNPKINDSLPPDLVSSPTQKHNALPAVDMNTTSSPSEIEKIVHSFISSTQDKEFSMTFRTNHRRFYEILL